MGSTAFERPSIAREFFLNLTRDPDPVSAIQRLIGATPPTFETEWCDFKGAEKIDDKRTKETWSQALAGFANTQGGVLIWGVDARKDPATGIDAAHGLSLVKNPSLLKSRLNELHHQATEPPVLGVEIEAYSIPNGKGEGFVVCFIPESPFRPHRAEHADRQFIIRAGDDFVTASVSLLRNLFYPQSRCLLVPTLKPRRQKVGYLVCGSLENVGTATAFDTLVIVQCDYRGTAYPIEHWSMRYDALWNARAEVPIHPGATMGFYAMGFPSAREAGFSIKIFAQNSEPTEWKIHYTVDEMESQATKPGERLAIGF